MSQENLEVVRSMVDSWNTGEGEEWLTFQTESEALEAMGLVEGGGTGALETGDTGPQPGSF